MLDDKMKQPPPLDRDLVELATLHYYPHNPRLHSAEQVEDIGDSIEQFSQDQDLVVQRETSQVLKGNGRLEAMLKRGFTHAWVTWVDDDEQTAKARLLSDNRLADKSSNDFEMLHDMLAGLDAMPPGFDEQWLDQHAAGVNDAGEEWEGMPEFENENQQGLTLTMHFADAESRDEFAKLVGQKITDKTKYLWHPEQEKDHVEGVRYKSES
jgi:hypothetical protein